MVIDFMEHQKIPRGKKTMMNILKENSSWRRKNLSAQFFKDKFGADRTNELLRKEIDLFINLEKAINDYFDMV
jgi:hypothetical protein